MEVIFGNAELNVAQIHAGWLSFLDNVNYGGRLQIYHRSTLGSMFLDPQVDLAVATSWLANIISKTLVS